MSQTLTRKFIENVLESHYSLGELTRVDPILESAFQSDNAIIQTSVGKFVIRLLHHDFEFANSSMAVYELLAKEGLQTPKPIRTKTNELVIVDNNRVIVIQEFVEGSPLKKDQDIFSKMDFFGREIGKFHKISKSLKLETLSAKVKRKQFYIDIIDELMANEDDVLNYLPKHEKNEWIIEQFDLWKKEAMEIKGLNHISKGVIQGDLKPEDFFIKNGELSGLLDFGAASYNYLMFDLGGWLMYTGLHYSKYSQEFQTFITSYLNSSGIPTEELMYLPFFYKTRGFLQIFYFAWRICNNVTQGLSYEKENEVGYSDGIRFVENSNKIPNDYFFRLAINGKQRN
ncbi:MAG: phosphotransferase [Candidatus Heimdallarchaeaceae archaeon]